MAKPKTLPYEAAETPEAYAVELHSTAGGSDKIYRLSIEPRGDLFVVNYANGRRGGTLATGTKTGSPVSYDEARKICNKQLFDKVGGGYVPIGGSRFGDGMNADAIATIARESSGYIPQLLAPVDDEDVDALIADDRYVAEEKHNGERRIVIVRNGEAIGGNRRGQTVALGSRIADSAAAIGVDVVLDGEQVGDVLHCWDVLVLDGRDLRALPLSQRVAHLDSFTPGPAIRPVSRATGRAGKEALIASVREAKGEGVVFKRLDAAYDPGRPGSQASWHKLKFWKSLSAVVGKVNAQRSVGLELVDSDGARLPIGNVTIPANHDVPSVGDVVEVTYLYAFDGGSLHQPVYAGRRSDIDPADCLASQREFFGAQADEEAPAAPGM